jgi:ABC-type antimicrobial peptide transport system permease subunit
MNFHFLIMRRNYTTAIIPARISVHGMISFVVFIISIMGLIGMVTYNTEKRLKEIGIRKVMGLLCRQ